MKKAISLLLVAMLVLSLGGCASEGQQLYEKYAPIIDMLEAKDYQGAIRDITAMAIEEQKGDAEEVPIMQVLCDTWTTTSEGAPAELTFSEDGTCTIGGETMTWLAEESWSETYLRLQISKDGEICRYVSLETGSIVPYLQLSYAEEHDDGIYSGEIIGTYYNHPMLPMLLRSWRAISEYECVGEISNFSINTAEANFSGDSYDWNLIESESLDSLTAHIDGKNDRAGAYTVTVTMRDGYPVVSFTDDATGESGLYYNYDYGYDETWVERRYAVASGYLTYYLENGSFWVDETENNYDNATGPAYLHQLFTDLGDYADAAQILENWDSVLFNQANRYLDWYLNGGSFYIDDVRYYESSALGYIHGLLTEISDYSEAAAMLDRFTIVEDVFLSSSYETTDNMGNVNSNNTEESREYNEQGQLIRLSNYGKLQRMYGTYSSNAYYTYNEDGVVTEIKIGYTDDVDALITPTYDENGNKISEHVVNNDGEFDVIYTYDDQNRLIEMRRPNTSYDDPENYYYTWTYTYDESGMLAQEVYGYAYRGEVEWEYIYAYTYDAAGNMTGQTETYNYYDTWNDIISRTNTHTAECICDDQGRVIQKNWTYGNTVYADGDEDRPSNVSGVYTYTYGDVYFFDSTGMETAE